MKGLRALVGVVIVAVLMALTIYLIPFPSLF